VRVLSRSGRSLLGFAVALFFVPLAVGTAVAAPQQDVEDSVRFAFQARARTLFDGGDEGQLAQYYDVAYSQGDGVVGARLLVYEHDKIAEFHRYLADRNMKVIAHVVTLRFEQVTVSGETAHATITESLGFRWVYRHKPGQFNATGLGTHHGVDLVLKDGRWLIRRDDYLDPFREWVKGDHRTPRG
jgi:hypothetical protein